MGTIVKKSSTSPTERFFPLAMPSLRPTERTEAIQRIFELKDSFSQPIHSKQNTTFQPFNFLLKSQKSSLQLQNSVKKDPSIDEYFDFEIPPLFILKPEDFAVPNSTPRWGKGLSFTRQEFQDWTAHKIYASDIPQRKPPLSKLPPVGIRNHGNFCYANSLFQIVASNPSMFQSILENSTPELKKLFEQYEASAKSNSPCDFNNHLSLLLFPDAAKRQHDVGEAFRNLLQRGCKNQARFEQKMQQTFVFMTQYAIEEEQLKEIQNFAAHDPGLSRSIEKYDPKLDQSTEAMLCKNNPMGPFLGTFLKEVRNETSFPLFTLPAPSEKGEPLLDYLTTSLVQKEDLQRKGDSPVINGIPYLHIHQSTHFVTPPEFFILDVKRTLSNGAVNKNLLTLNDEIISFPGGYFNQEENVSYRLTGFAQHLGNQASSGHYISFVTRKNENNQTTYYTINDATTSEISREKFLESFASCSAASFEKTILSDQKISSSRKVYFDLPQGAIPKETMEVLASRKPRPQRVAVPPEKFVNPFRSAPIADIGPVSLVKDEVGKIQIRTEPVQNNVSFQPTNPLKTLTRFQRFQQAFASLLSKIFSIFFGVIFSLFIKQNHADQKS